jgi:hypothetical protein
VKTLWNAALPLVALMVASSPATADEVTLNVKDVATITDDSGVSRILFRVDGAEALSGIAIARAILDVGLTGESEDRAFRLQIHPVTTQWVHGSVDWGTGWSRPGGDFEDDLYGRASVHFGGGTTHGLFDLTTPLKEIVESGMVADGFILTLAPVEGRGIPSDAVARFADLDEATITIRYRNLPPVPPAIRNRG